MKISILPLFAVRGLLFTWMMAVSSVVVSQEPAGVAEALEKVTPQHAAGMTFLSENMSADDQQNLTADFLLEHVRIAYEARQAAKWGTQIPEDVFQNDVLPYASVNERRDNVRLELREQFWPQVKDCDSISEAAAKLNQIVFAQLKVKYSTKRRRADQGPKESMETGLASCTGLSILLIDACRACGIPARFVGTPLWVDGSGNHSWVEIWDQGWHYTGAAEPTGSKLDAGWFTEKAAKQVVGDARHGIYAVSFRHTNTPFPLVWARRGQADIEVFAVEVTERYLKKPTQQKPGMVQLQFKALHAGGDRCQANLIVRNQAGQIAFRGQTNDESHDANDHLLAELEPGSYTVELTTDSGVITQSIEAEQNGELIVIRASQEASKSDVNAETPSAAPATEVLKQLEDFLNNCGGDLKPLASESFASVPLSRDEADAVTTRLFAYLREQTRTSRREEFEAKVVKLGELEMKYDWTKFGEAPRTGHSLYISMHGGGNADARVNDKQWNNQKRLYELDEGIYVAPRAPTNTWNLWHEGHIDGMFTRLIADMIAFENINPDRVYITGYSAGGDGVFQLAPRMADQLAAAAMMAGHPNETRPLGLRNLPFTIHMGANDAAYKRNEKAAQWKELLSGLKSNDPGGYEHWVEIHEGKGHWMDLQDAKGIAWLAQFERNMIPDRIVWLQDDVLHDRFYWLSVDRSIAKAGQEIVAQRSGNRIQIDGCPLDKLTILLRDDMLDLNQDVEVTMGDKLLFKGKVSRTTATIAGTLLARGDKQAVFTAACPVSVVADSR